MERKWKDTAEVFLSSGKELQPFCPFPRASCREAYEALPAALRQKLIAMGEECLGYAYPAIRATDFMEFQRSGNRVAYEDLYFNRRYALNSLAAAECAENKGRFLDDIINGIFALCEESGWQLPAHNSYGSQASRNLLPDHTRPILDLFACETGAQLACILYLLGPRLDMVSPQITKRIRYELETRVIAPYLTEHFWWMGRGEEPMNNWTPWCTQNILYTVFLYVNSQTAPDCPDASRDASSDCPAVSAISSAGNGCPWSSCKELCRKVLLKAAESCDFFLKDYGEDGCCDEGAQYYRHAGLCLDGAAQVLNRVTGGAFESLLHLDKIKNIASYIVNVHVDGKYYFNFADCSPVAGRAGVREYLFGKHTGQPDLMQFAAEDFRSAEQAGDCLFQDESHRLNLFYRMQAVFCYEEIKAFHRDVPLIPKDIYYPSVGLFLTRNDTFSLAVKAGDNNDSHNHNDTGSLTLYKKGRPVLVDIGVESYTQKTFSPRRYEIWTMQSGYHNLPSIEGLDQRDGAAWHADNVEVSMDTSSVSMDLAGAYPLAEAGHPHIRYTRKVTFRKEDRLITLTDSTNSRNVILNFITYEKPVIPASRESVILVGNARMEFRGGELAAVETLPITDKRLQTAWDHDLYRIRLKMTEEVFEMRIN